MVAVQRDIAVGSETLWTIMAVNLPPVLTGDRHRARERALLIRTLDSWLRHHHHGVAMPAADDAARGDTVCVGFRREQAETALAFRMLCGSLGLTPTLKQFRVAPNRCPRTSPPPV